MANPVSHRLDGNIGIIETDNPPVNALSTAVRQGLADAVAALDADAAARAIVIHCAGRTFFAGADIREFDQAPQRPILPDVIDRIEAASKPVIAALHGTALGGGFEVALGCHYRVALPSARVGLPEIKLGLLPGAGGTQRLPRLIGLTRALELIMGGDPVDAARARELGIVDLVVDGDILAQSIDFARRAVIDNLPLRRLSELDIPADSQEAALAETEAAAERLLARRQGFDAPARIVESVRNSVTMPFAEALVREREIFMELKAGYQSAAQRHLFFAERAALKIDDMPADTEARRIGDAAVLGAGTMGGGIAMCFANAGIPVTLIDAEAAALARGVATIRQNYTRTAKRLGEGDAWVEERMERINPVTDLGQAASADMVVEAVFEDMAIKKRIFADLDRLCAPHAVLATNTSTLDVDAIAAATGRPQSVVGMHFFSPANVMRLLEVVRGEKTGFVALKTAIETGRRIGKLPVTVGVCNGFVGNRMLYARSAQIEKLLLEGAWPQDIDAALTAFGFAMGPCAVGDLAGLDVGWRARKEAGRKAPIADAICEAGRFGQKTGKGYYRYEEGSRKPLPDPEVEAIIRRIAEERGVRRRRIGAEEIFERSVFAMINEGARILEEGIAARSSDIDLIWVNGYGWPAYEGGPMFYADRIGPATVANRLRDHAEKLGDGSLEPAPLLARLAKEGGTFAAAGGG